MKGKIILPAWACDFNRLYHFAVTHQALDLLKQCLAEADYELEVRTRKDDLFGPIVDWNRTMEIIKNLFLVQGLEYVEGCDITGPLESLIAEYARLKAQL